MLGRRPWGTSSAAREAPHVRSRPHTGRLAHSIHASRSAPQLMPGARLRGQGAAGRQAGCRAGVASSRGCSRTRAPRRGALSATDSRCQRRARASGGSALSTTTGLGLGAPVGDGVRHLLHRHGEAVDGLFDMGQRDSVRRDGVRVGCVLLERPRGALQLVRAGGEGPIRDPTVREARACRHRGPTRSA